MEVQKLVNECFFFGKGGRRQGDSGTLQRGFVWWRLQLHTKRSFLQMHMEV